MRFLWWLFWRRYREVLLWGGPPDDPMVRLVWGDPPDPIFGSAELSVDKFDKEWGPQYVDGCLRMCGIDRRPHPAP